MALEGAPCGPSMKTSSGGRFFEWTVTGRGMEAAGFALFSEDRYELFPLLESGKSAFLLFKFKTLIGYFKCPNRI